MGGLRASLFIYGGKNMSLFWHVPGFQNYRNDVQEGDTQFFMHIDDKTGKRCFLVIDGGTPAYFDILYKDLK